MTDGSVNQNNIKQVLVSEFHSCRSYWERLSQVTLTMSDKRAIPEFMKLMVEFLVESGRLAQDEIFCERLKVEKIPAGSHDELTDWVHRTFDLWDSLIKLPLSFAPCSEAVVKFINLTYEFCHDVHHIVEAWSAFQVQYPRLNLLEMNIEGETFDQNWLEEKSDEKVALIDRDDLIPWFHLDLNKLKAVESRENSRAGLVAVHSLDWQREKKYKENMEQGHRAILEQKPHRALEFFTKAKELNKSAEALTMLGWTWHYLGKNEKAKAHCMMAIKQDPDYGPPYNDLGTYLLKEGHLKESLKWFSLAKEASKYENREFPYINCGRVYLMMGENAKAISEFKTALKIAPHNKNLKETIQKLGQDLSVVEPTPHLREVTDQPEESGPWNQL